MAYQKVYYPTIGNAALKPEPIITPKPVQKPRKVIAKAVKKEIEAERHLMQAKAIGTIFLLALSMLILMNRMTTIYTLQASFNDLKAEQRVLIRENEDLRSKVIVASSIKAISEDAQSLGLVDSRNIAPIEVDFSRENFSSDPEPAADKNWLLSLIDKAKDLL